MSENRRGGMGGNRKLRLKRYGVGCMFTGRQGLPPRPTPCTERPAQQSTRGHGSNLGASPRPRQVTLLYSHRNPGRNHDQTSAQKLSPAPHPPATATVLGLSCRPLPRPKCTPTHRVAISSLHTKRYTGLLVTGKFCHQALTQAVKPQGPKSCPAATWRPLLRPLPGSKYGQPCVVWQTEHLQWPKGLNLPYRSLLKSRVVVVLRFYLLIFERDR